MIVKLLSEHHLEFLSLRGGFRGSSESTLVKMSNCWKSHALTHMVFGNENLDSCQIYKIPTKSCRNKKLNWFQYRILNIILATTNLLLKCGIIQDIITYALFQVAKEFSKKLNTYFGTTQCHYGNLGKYLRKKKSILGEH